MGGLLKVAHDLSNPLGAARLRLWSIEQAVEGLRAGVDPEALAALVHLHQELSGALGTLQERIGAVAADGWSLLDEQGGAGPAS